MTADGLPVGLEFDALSGGDRALLSLGLSLEAVLGRGRLRRVLRPTGRPRERGDPSDPLWPV